MNVLAIGAHFDDVELGCGGTIARHAMEGDNVDIFVATVSGFADHQKKTVRRSEIAKKEAEHACAVLGVNQLHCGNFETLAVEFTDNLNIEIISLVERLQIDLVYTHWVGDVHHDHQAVGKSSLHSCRHVPRILMYRSNWYHSSVDFRGNYYVDISDFWKVKEEAIKAHVSEVARTGHSWIDFFRNEAENAGQRIGVRFAEVFEVVKYLR